MLTINDKLSSYLQKSRLLGYSSKIIGLNNLDTSSLNMDKI